MMTFEEAKDVFLNRGWLPVENGVIFDGNKWRESIQVISSWLEKQPCEDCVSRKFMYELGATCIAARNEDGKLIALGAIKELPPVTTQPKIGHWIKYGIPRCGEQHYKCTACDDYINFGVYSDYYLKAFKYCPNCGAKMQEVEE